MLLSVLLQPFKWSTDDHDHDDEEDDEDDDDKIIKNKK